MMMMMVMMVMMVMMIMLMIHDDHGTKNNETYPYQVIKSNMFSSLSSAHGDVRFLWAGRK